METQSNIISDMSVLTKVPVKILTALAEKECLCIGSAIHDALLRKDTSTALNIGIGTLCVDLISQQCKFIPNRELKSAIRRSIDEKVDVIELSLEQALVDKLLSICGDIL